MCGFVSILRFDSRPKDSAALRMMGNAIAHRGPDDHGVLTVDNVDFVHQRLSIIDLKSGKQPMTREGVSVVFNGEVYNYIELRSDLLERGHQFDTDSDTEVLLRCYLEFGPDFVAKLNGMFAFVLYDPRAHRLMAARDHFGIKPLYRCRVPGGVLFASEIKSLLLHPEVAAEADATALGEYVTFQHTLSERTLFAGIEKVLPAHFELYDSRNGEHRHTGEYWRLDYSVDESISEAQAIDELRSLIRASVHRQLRSDVPLGAYLSGGLDSSTVAVLAAGDYDDTLKTFTGAFREGADFDESEHAAAVAKQIDARQFLVYPTEQEFIDNLSHLSFAMDEPAAGPGLFPQFIVSQLASENVKVCLGGQGGDEMFGGYARYPIAYLELALSAAIDAGQTSSDGISLTQLTSQLPMLKQYKPMLKRFLSKGMFDDLARRYFHLLDRSEGVAHVMADDFQQTYDREAVFAEYLKLYDSIESDSYLNRITGFDVKASLPALLHVEDRVSMAVSLESRVPLLDPDVMDFAAKVSPAIKWKHGEPKYLFKQAVAPWLPESVVARKDKMGFPVPLHHWARGGARDFVHDVLLSRRSRERGLCKPAEVEQLINAEGAFGRGIWALLQLELWHQNFIDEPKYQRTSGDHHAVVLH